MGTQVGHAASRWPHDAAADVWGSVRARIARIVRAARTRPAVVPALAPGERVVATFTDAETGPLVAADRALYRGEGGGWARLGWEQIDHAVRDQRGQRLLVYLWPADSPRCVTLRVPPDSPLVALVRERVSATTLLTTQVRLGDLGQARVTVRRRPATQELLWVVLLDPSVDATDPRLPVQIDTAIRQLAASAGLTT